MKKIFAFFALLSFLCVNGQYEEGIVYYNNGNISKGLVKNKGVNGMKFKESENSKSFKFNYKEILGFDKKNEKYRYKNEKGSSPILVKIILKGKLNLYSKTYTSSGMPISNGGSFGGGSTTYYFIEKGIEFIKLGKRVKKKHQIYFNDCVILIEKLNKKILKRKNPHKIINFYNTNCN
jgi:hypothetical protein